MSVASLRHRTPAVAAEPLLRPYFSRPCLLVSARSYEFGNGSDSEHNPLKKRYQVAPHIRGDPRRLSLFPIESGNHRYIFTHEPRRRLTRMMSRPRTFFASAEHRRNHWIRFDDQRATEATLGIHQPCHHIDEANHNDDTKKSTHEGTGERCESSHRKNVRTANINTHSRRCCHLLALRNVPFTTLCATSLRSGHLRPPNGSHGKLCGRSRVPKALRHAGCRD